MKKKKTKIFIQMDDRKNTLSVNNIIFGVLFCLFCCLVEVCFFNVHIILYQEFLSIDCVLPYRGRISKENLRFFLIKLKG